MKTTLLALSIALAPLLHGVADPTSPPPPVAPTPFKIRPTLVPLSPAPESSKTVPAAEKLPAIAERPADATTAATPAPAAVQRRIISSDIGGRDLEFLTSAKHLSIAQNWLGDEAAKAETDQIKAVGGALKAAQSDEDKLITEIAAQKGVNFPAEDKLPLEMKKVAAQLGSLKGPRFDKAVIDQIITVNQKEVSVFEAATHSKDAEIKKFAEQVLPLAKEKLQLAEKMTGTAQRTNVTPTFRTPIPTPTAQ